MSEMSQPAAKKRKTSAPLPFTGTRIVDARFANIQSDPRYRLPGRKQKIKVDKRFAKALQDESFSRKARVDRYGRPLETDSERRRLKRKYDFEDDEENSLSNRDESNNEESDDEPDDDDLVQAELQRVTETRDVLREGRDVSSSEDESSSEEESDEEQEDEVAEIGPGVQDQDVPMGEVSSRLAVVNLDWDNIRAEDLMAVFQSFLPATGRLLKVSIYPSEFGKERMEREEMEGPPKEIFANIEQDEDPESGTEEEEDIKNSIIKPDDGSEFDSTALRQYQLERLRYFYAVLTFSTAETAKSIYDAVDGAEYLSTANFFDLRFVPNETDFSADNPREECERISASYKPNDFVTDALQHSKVKLTWDADDMTRKEAQARAFRGGRKELDENDLKAYLGTDSESEDEEVPTEATSGLSKKEVERQRMRSLLGLAPEPVKSSSKDKKDVHMGDIQITFSSGLSGQPDNAIQPSDEEATTGKPKTKRSVFENSPEPVETTVEKYIRKEKERKQRRKEKTKAGRDGIDTTTAAQQVDSSEKQDEDHDSDLGFADPFFVEATHDVKSTHKQRKAERLQRRAEREAEEAASAKQRAELELLMADDDTTDGKKGRAVRHFDMTEIEKAEKARLKNRKKKGNKSKGRKDGIDHEAVLAGDDFQINTEDPRFARLFENHEFAIDPTNSRYKGTKGMKALLDEGRKRKEKEVGKDRAEESEQQRKDKKDGSPMNQENEVMGLVGKIKRRNR